LKPGRGALLAAAAFAADNAIVVATTAIARIFMAVLLYPMRRPRG
jgi:hypothetical protein